MDGSKQHPKMTAALDIGDKYSYLCLLDSDSGEVIEEGRLRTTPESFRRRFASDLEIRRLRKLRTWSTLFEEARPLRRLQRLQLVVRKDGSHNAPSQRGVGSLRVRMEA
jgi:hypothetical protein